MTKTTKPKVSLTAPATFSAPVDIHMPGIGVGEIIFKFKHRTKTEIKELMATLTPAEPKDPDAPTAEETAAREAFVAPEDVDVILDIASGWDLPDQFDEASVRRMTELYVGSPRSILQAYLGELSGGRVKNL